jgi:Domain of unknown function (DUF5666)
MSQNQTAAHDAPPEDDFDPGWDDPAEDEPILPQRQRVRWLTAKSVVLLAILTGLIGFYAGIREEKSSAAGSSSTGTAAAATGLASGRSTLASGGGSAGGAPGGATSRTRSKASGTKAGSSGAFPGFGSGGPPSGGSFGGGGGTSGTVASVEGDTLYVKEASGNTVKVHLLATTTLSKSESVGKKAIHPGDTVSVAGTTGSRGTVTATSVADSGNDSASSSSTASTSSSSSG